MLVCVTYTGVGHEVGYKVGYRVGYEVGDIVEFSVERGLFPLYGVWRRLSNGLMLLFGVWFGLCWLWPCLLFNLL